MGESHFDKVARYVNSKQIGEIFTYRQFEQENREGISSYLLAIDYLENFVDLCILDGMMYDEDDSTYKVLHHVPPNLTNSAFNSLVSVLIYKKEDLWKMWFMESYEEFIDHMKKKYHFR